MLPPDAAGARSAPQTGFNSDMPHTETAPTSAPVQKLAPGDQEVPLGAGCHADMVWHAGGKTATVTLTDDLNQRIGKIDIDENAQSATVTQYDPRTGKENKSSTFTASYGMVFDKGSPKAGEDSLDAVNMANVPTDLTVEGEQRFAVTLQSPTGNGSPVSVEIATNINGHANGGNSKLDGQNPGIGAIVSIPSASNPPMGDDGLLIGAVGSGKSQHMAAQYLTNFQRPEAPDYESPTPKAPPGFSARLQSSLQEAGKEFGTFLKSL